MAGALLPVDLLAALIASTIVGERSLRLAAHAALAIALLAAGGLYRAHLSPSALDDLPAIFGRSLIAGAIVTTIGVYQDSVAGVRILYVAIWFAVFSTLLRAPCYAVLRSLRRRGLVGHRTLIVGGGQVASDLAQTLIDHPEIGLRPAGFVDDDPLFPADRRPVPLLGPTDQLRDVIVERDIGNVVVAFGSVRESAVVDLLRTCDLLPCEIFFVPRLYEVHATSRGMEMAWGIPLVRMRRAAFRTRAWRVKRVIDVGLAAAALVVLAPLMAACAIAVRLRVGKPVLFRQERVGLDGRPFTMLKFRSLQPANDPESGDRWSVADDAGMTRVGRVLRRTSFDELPQLWNIVRGDMTLVGPRPERPYFDAEFTRQFPRYIARHRVPGGLTGMAQVHGLRGDTSIADRARFDNYYIENWSLWEDSKLILKTASQVLRASGR